MAVWEDEASPSLMNCNINKQKLKTCKNQIITVRSLIVYKLVLKLNKSFGEKKHQGTNYRSKVPKGSNCSGI